MKSTSFSVLQKWWRKEVRLSLKLLSTVLTDMIEARFRRTWENELYEDDFFFVSQMFEDEWMPRDTRIESSDETISGVPLPRQVWLERRRYVMIGLLRTAFRSFVLDGIKVNDLEFGDRLDWLVRSQKYDEFWIKTSGMNARIMRDLLSVTEYWSSGAAYTWSLARDHFWATSIICFSGLRDVEDVSSFETGELRYFSQPVCLNFPVRTRVVPYKVILHRFGSRGWLPIIAQQRISPPGHATNTA